MCRYGVEVYKTHYVCLKHRVSVKSVSETLCMICREPMLNMGRDFKPPRKNNDNQWKKLEVITKGGTISRVFDSCGCTGPGSQPKTFSEAKHKYQ